MSPRLRSLIALWFVVQIVVPFTAPLQTFDLLDVFGARHHRCAPMSPESSSTPTTLELESGSQVFVSPIDASALRASTSLVSVDEVTASAPFLAISSLSPVPKVQRSILRL